MPSVSQLPPADTPLTGAELVVGDQVQGAQNTTVVMTVDEILAIAAQGTYEATFKSGWLQYTGPSGLTASGQFEVGLLLPNPSGSPGPCLLLGTGGGGGTNVSAWIIQDEAYDDITAGNTLGITAGSTQSAGTAAGGLLWLIGGASYGGTGGQLLLQGGTSATGPGGIAVLQGGNATGGSAAPGDAYVTGGLVGSVGANVHLIATYLGSTSGLIRMRQNSNIGIDFVPQDEGSGGTVEMGIYLYTGGGYGTAGQGLISGGPGAGVSWGNVSFNTASPYTVTGQWAFGSVSTNQVTISDLGVTIDTSGSSSGSPLGITPGRQTPITVVNPEGGSSPYALMTLGSDYANTGSQTATFSATNKPGSGTTSPSAWLCYDVNGTLYYVPMWQ